MITPVILCGGSGTRLWPLSRRDMPKQLVRLFEGRSLLQQTLLRFASAAGTAEDPAFAKPIVVAAADCRFLVAEQAAELGLEVEIALEPAPRDTYAAVLAGAALAARANPDGMALVAPSDHLISDAPAFRAAARAAAEAARATGGIATLGVTPTRPATGYGYIRPGAALAAPEGASALARFVEKPDEAAAGALIAEGCLWNAGLFCFSPEALLARVGAEDPDARAAIAAAVNDAERDLDFLRLAPVFETIRKISFDYAVMEGAENAAVVETACGWSDLGDWSAFWETTAKDAAGNAATGDVALRESTGCYVRSETRLVCALGVDNLAVVETPDVVLVAAMDRVQDIKALVSDLEAQGREEAVSHAKCHRPWGWYQTMDLGARFRVKRIMVKPGAKLSLQMHHHRAEHWVGVSGTAEVTIDETVRLLRENESVYIPLGAVHRLANPGVIPVEIIEVQTGAYLEEDDIVRIEDVFGRT